MDIPPALLTRRSVLSSTGSTPQSHGRDERCGAAAITQDPIAIGKECVASAVAALSEQKLPAFDYTAFHWYDATNLANPTIAP